MPKLFSFTLAVGSYLPGCASSGLDSPKDREARAWHRDSATEHGQKAGWEQVLSRDDPVRNHTSSQIKQRTVDKADKAGQKPLSPNSKLQNCRPQLRPRGQT